MYVSQALAPEHDRALFACGRISLDDWLRRLADTAAAKRVGRTFVWLDDGHVVGYYTLSAHLLRRDPLSRSMARGDPAAIPAALLGRLALDKSLHGRGLGAVLLVEALRRVVRAAEDVATRYVVVDAIDDAAAGFYRHHGFRDTPISRRLVRKLGDVAADVAGESASPGESTSR